MKPISLLLKGAASAGMLFAFTMAADAAEKVRVALGDVVSVETLAFVVALERAKDRGVDYELTSFAKEELAIQAIINGQSDLGIGTPYSVIQKSKLPLRNIFQMSRLVFFPVVSKEYKTWKDLDGQPFTFHARGTGTEAIGNIIAKREGIEFGERSYVPGSENRIIAMMNGQIKATIVDLANKNLLMEKAGDQFHVLPGVDEAGKRRAGVRQRGLAEEQPRTGGHHRRGASQALARDESRSGRHRRGARQAQPARRPAEGSAGRSVPFYTEAIKEGVFEPLEDGSRRGQGRLSFYTRSRPARGPGRRA